jgi:outer membrane protein insertion porin family
VRSRTTATLARIAAICGLLVAPSAAIAQLRCANTPNDTLIRKVSFEGNATFPEEELLLHVVSTQTDFFRRRAPSSKVLIGTTTAIGVLIGLTRDPEMWARARNTVYFGGGFAAVGYGLSRLSGIPRCLGRGTLSGDMLNLAGFYRDEGFKDVRVDTATRYDGRWVDITFKVNEGRPVLVDTLSIIGFDTVALGPIPKSLNSRKGGRYSPTLTQEDLDSLQARLQNNGYPDGQVTRNVTYLSTYGTSVEFKTEPGIRARIGSIIIDQRSLDSTDTPTIDQSAIRALLRFREGDLYSARVLLEAERRFYRAGAFLTVEVAPDTRRLATDSVVDVRVNVVEDLMHTGTVEPAIGTLDCLRSRGSYSDKGFLGGVNRLDVSGSVSKIGLAQPTDLKGLRDVCQSLRTLSNAPQDENEISTRQVNYNATVSFTRPIPLPGGLLPSVSAYTERRGGYQAYLRTTLIGGAVTMQKTITRTVAFEGSYNLEFGHTEASETVLCFLFRACSESDREQLKGGDKRLALLGARFSRDRRNSVDSASSGTFVRLDLRASNRAWLSDATLEFMKGTIDAAWYHRLGTGVLAVRARAGRIFGGQQTNGVRLAPPQERLYVGGETSVRGFRQNELGPLTYVTSDDTLRALKAVNEPDDRVRETFLQDSLTMRIIPAGGNAMYVGNLEYRVTTPFLKSLQTVFFVDAGALSTTGITAVSGSTQFRFTPGIAFKYFSPVGAVQVNLGYNSYDLLPGAVFNDQFIDPADNNPDPTKRLRVLRCVSGTSGGVCQPLQAIRPLAPGSLRRLTLSIAFPPDF